MENISRDAWHNAFGNVPPGFENRVQTTVAKMESSKAHVKRKLIPILALVLVLLAATALALERLGLLQTLSNNLRTYLQPEAFTMVQKNIQQNGGALPDTDFTVEEALYDGRQVYALIRVHAKEPDRYLLMDSTAEPAWGIEWWKDFNTEAGQTYSYQASATKRDILQADADMDISANPFSEIRSKEISYDGEDILYTLTLSANKADAAAVALSISTYNVYRDDLSHEERLQRGKIAFTVPESNARTVFTADMPMSLPLSGLTIESLTLEQTPIATYITALYKLNANATDKHVINFMDGIWFRWLDDGGKPIPEGNSQFSLIQDKEDTLELTAAYRAFESIPDSIALEFYNGMSKERFDTLHITLTKQGGTNP